MCERTERDVPVGAPMACAPEARGSAGRGARRAAVMLAALFQLWLVSPALGADPRERVKEILGVVSTVLADPHLQGPDQEGERKQRVRRIIHDTFDFRAMSRESLATHWEKLTTAQREDFARLFGDLFEESYNRLVLRFLGASETRYGTESIEADRAVVQTVLVRKNEGELPVDYHLLRDGQRWAVSDVVVDGVSLARNFRAQFDKTIRTSSYEALIEKMKAKLAQASGP